MASSDVLAAQETVATLFALHETLMQTSPFRKPKVYEEIDRCLDRLNEIKAAAFSPGANISV